jgi:hypothetical protein
VPSEREAAANDHNLVGNATGSGGVGGTDLVGASPALGPLQDSGGPTATHALLAGSPALNAGDAATYQAALRQITFATAPRRRRTAWR